jgi:hypothetical protein
MRRIACLRPLNYRFLRERGDCWHGAWPARNRRGGSEGILHPQARERAMDHGPFCEANRRTELCLSTQARRSFRDRANVGGNYTDRIPGG